MSTRNQLKGIRPVSSVLLVILVIISVQCAGSNSAPDQTSQKETETKVEKSDSNSTDNTSNTSSDQQKPESSQQTTRKNGEQQEKTKRKKSNGDKNFDKVFTMKVKPGMLKFSTDSFKIPAGGRIKLVFKNNGSLQHNLVICVQGDPSLAMEIAKKSWNLKNPLQNDYVPDSKKILVASKLLNPNEKEVLTFQAPEETGDHPYVCTFPGHAQTMRGIMHVVSEETSNTTKQTSEKSSK